MVESLNRTFQDAASVVVTHYSGLNVGEISDLRGQMRAAGANFRVTKNRLARLALEGTTFAPLLDMFNGPTAIAYSDDVVAPAKVAVTFAKQNHNLVIIGGAMGETLLDADGVKNLASMPSLDELRGKIIRLVQAPATKIAGVLQAPAGQLARVLSAYANEGEAA